MYAGGSRKQGHVSALTSREGVLSGCVDRASRCVGKARGHADRTARHERGARARAGASRALMVGYVRERVERVLALTADATGVSERSDRARPRLGAGGRQHVLGDSPARPRRIQIDHSAR